MKKLKNEYEYIVIGTGAAGGGCAVELARQGKEVLMLEKGKWHNKLGNKVLAKLMYEGCLLGSKSKQGIMVARGRTVGGSTMIYQGNAFDPQEHLLNAMGIDFRPETEEIKKELNVKPFPDSFFDDCAGGKHLREVATSLGYEMTSQQKFINPELCNPKCDNCMDGCPKGAKWTTREWVKEVVSLGGRLEIKSMVDRLEVDKKNSKVTGVILKNGTVIHSKHVILAGGAIGSAGILQRSGITKLGTQQVGSNFTMDPMTIVLGWNKDKKYGMWNEQSFTHAKEFKEGFIISNTGGFTAWALGCTLSFKSAITNMPRGIFYSKHAMGMFVKFADAPAGTISAKEKIDKEMSAADNSLEEKGIKIIKEIMTKAGANPKSFTCISGVGGHPGCTTAMGKAVNRDFSTEFKGLYICDAGVLPVSPGAPPALNIMGFGRLCAKILTGQVNIEDRYIKEPIASV